MAVYDELAALFTRHPIPTRYRLDLPALVQGLLPVALRNKPHLSGLLLALLSPTAGVYAAYLSYTVRVRRELTYSGQKLAFERALNDRFDPDQARIQLVDSDSQARPLYINFEAEQQPPVFVRMEPEGEPLYLYAGVELSGQVGFTVRVPAQLQPRAAALNARIRELKLALINYTIVYF
ncbi:hypothetical protein [Hymenobacter rubripertinctus]|uniref:Uncharacterized protein n=1 Tax=Hymenobacter rubripertinctus TaxID=2029981 RepID=A0A418QMX5_9BACT|nr:hypothetical protein [Hymenobacter rubripertinctus]RIY06448.1 hypothetical protein D0T11_18585 [Hymenobacter rubripertinctus]